MAERMARMPDFTWEWVLITDGCRILHENESLLRTDIGFYMRMSPYYGRTLYDRTNGLNAGFYIRKSPFMGGYYMAEQMARRPKPLHKKGSFWGRILHGKANGLKADFYRKMSPFTDGYYMAEHGAWRPTLTNMKTNVVYVSLHL